MESQSKNDLVYDPSIKFKIRKIALPIAIVLCSLLLITCIVLAVLYSQQQKQSSGAVSRAEKPKYEICDDERCFHLGLEMVNKMNKSVDPCQDFYAYACGGWQRSHLKDNASRVTTGTVVTWENLEVVRKALQQAHLNYSKNDAVMKTSRVYNSCMNTSAIDAKGLQPLIDLIQEYGGWNLSMNYQSGVSVAQRIGRAARDLNVNSLFGVVVTPNVFDSDTNILMFTPSALGLTHHAYFKRDNASEQKRQVYKKYMKDVSQMFNSSYEKMMAIYDFEVKLAKIASGKDPDAELIDYLKKMASARTRRSALFGPMTLLTFCKATTMPWPFVKEVLDILFDRHLTGQEKVFALPQTIPYAKALYRLYGETNHSLIADYIMWRVVHHYTFPLPNRYRSSNGFSSGVLSVPRWNQCIGAMITPFDMTLGLLYVDAQFNDVTKIKIKEMIENIRTSFIERLPSQTWMDSVTQEKAKEKAQAMTIAEIGYPAFIKDPQKLGKLYESLNTSDNAFDNYKAANHFVRMRNLKNFGKPVDKNEWTFKSPANYNGFNYYGMNKIVFLAGILQPPMYSPSYPRYLNYGGIGMVIGHEITHGFDGKGHLYDKNGNIRNWWSQSAQGNFVLKSKCLEAQYNKYKVFDKYVNGTRTLDENIADNGGIKLAYDAYQQWKMRNGTENILPGLDLNPDQLFFLGFAQTWCGIYDMEGAYKQLEGDSHTTEKYRVIGSLSNFKKFSEVFKCPLKSGMNPVDKCSVW